MDLQRLPETDLVSGLNGVVEVLLAAVIADARWAVVSMGWNDEGTIRTMHLAHNANGRRSGLVSLQISETMEHPNGWPSTRERDSS